MSAWPFPTAGRFGLPILRRRLPGHLQRQDGTHPFRRRSRRSGEPRRPVRQGSLRLRLRPPSAPADQAADPPRRRVPKGGDFERDPERGMDVFRERAGTRRSTSPGGTLRHIRDRAGPAALAGFGSAKGSNEEAYLFQKLVRTGDRNNHVDHLHAAVPCHFGGGAARGHRLGRGRDLVEDVTLAEVVILIGANRREPPGGRDLDEERGEERHQADRLRPAPLRPGPHRAPHLQFNPDTDVALLNGMMHAIVAEGLVDEPFIAAGRRLRRAEDDRRRGDRPSAWRDLRHRRGDPPCRGRTPYATAKASMILWGMGDQPARARHRQRARADRPRAHHRPDRPARHRPASAARPEQRPGRDRRRPDPDDATRIPEGRRAQVRTRFEALWGCRREASTRSPG